MAKYKHIFWDWNGTLFDDLKASLDSINNSLEKRGLQLVDERRYFDIFCFPVEEYYKRLGFDFNLESYDSLAVEFIEEYKKASLVADLHKNVKAIVGKLAVLGINQYILSASEKDILLADLVRQGIKGFFSEILACDNIYAKGKLSIGQEFLAKNNLDGKVLLIGDTIHDYEVATALGFDVLLFDKGHTSRKELEKCGQPIVSDLLDIFPYIFTNYEYKKYNLERFVLYRKGNAEEIAVYEKKQEEYTSNNDFANTYHAKYNDMKNSRKTEDW